MSDDIGYELGMKYAFRTLGEMNIHFRIDCFMIKSINKTYWDVS